MSKKCRLCGSYQFNLHQEDVDQGDLCDVHYWKVRALKGKEVTTLAWDYRLAVQSYVHECKHMGDSDTIDDLEQTMGEASRKMDVAIYEFNKLTHTL